MRGVDVRLTVIETRLLGIVREAASSCLDDGRVRS
jgi:hypothetical protein